VADLYLDNDVSQRLIPRFQEAGHSCTTAIPIGLDSARDEVQLLSAVQRGAILVTYIRRDFMLLHRA
jgi:hypothetical protein